MLCNRLAAGIIRLLPACIGGLLLFYTPCEAGVWYWAAYPDKERLVITLDRPVGVASVSRTGTRRITVLLPAKEPLTRQPDMAPPRSTALLAAVQNAGSTISITMRTNAFGYIVLPPDGNRLVIDFFADPIGELWQPVSGTTATRTPPRQAMPVPKPAPPAVQRETPAPPAPRAQSKPPAAQKNVPPARPTLSPNSTTAMLPAMQRETPVPKPVDAATSAPTPPAQSSSLAERQPPTLRNDAPPPAPSSASAPTEMPQPFFSVPYTFRARINDGGPTDWKPIPPKLTPPVEILPQPQKKQAVTKNTAPNGMRGVVSSNTGPHLDGIGKAPSVKEALPKNAIPTSPVSTDPKATHDARSPASSAADQDDNTGGNTAGGVVSSEERHAQPYPETPAPVPSGKQQVDPVQVPPRKMEKISGDPLEPEPDIIYVDEDGNPVPPPVSSRNLLFQAKVALNNGEPEKTLTLLDELHKRTDLQPTQREEVLYLASDALYAQGKHDLLANYDQITKALTIAMNYNPKSERIPAALLRMGLLNLKVGNTREAEAYFNILKREHPNDANIPLTYYYWGDYFFNQKQYQKAADQFQYVVQNHPDSQFVRESSVGLARSLYRLGYYAQAYQIVDYIEKRWPRFYVEYPPFLNMMGDVAYRMQDYEAARGHYWTYYNIDPDGEEADLILARLGDIYLQEERIDSARQIYEEAARKFPDKDGGLISLMRLAEEGIHDAPDIGDMFTVFDRPYSLRPRDIYQKIISNHPKSTLAPLAQLKLAMWQLWNRQYSDSLSTATEFVQKFPDSELLPRVREVAMKNFNMLAADNIDQKNYERIMQAWDQYPIVRGQESELTPESRIALGISMAQRDQPAKALEVIDPFFRGLKVPTFSEMAMNLALSTYLGLEKWDAVLTLADRIELWELTPEAQRQLDYARALALENTGRPDEAIALWQQLHLHDDVPQEEEGYTQYFLARDAEKRRDLSTAYTLAQGSLRNFTELAEKNPDQADKTKIKDLLNMLMDITEVSGRASEALDWAAQYADHTTADDVDYPAWQYRLARLHKKNEDMKQWRSILTKLRDTNPQSLYGRMAASELRSHDLSQSAAQFSPTGQL